VLEARKGVEKKERKKMTKIYVKKETFIERKMS